MTPIQVALYATTSLILLPLAILSLMTGSKVPDTSPFSKYYAAERYLGLVGNLFLLSLVATALEKLAVHFGLIDGSVADQLTGVVAMPFLALMVAYLVLWFRAYRKVRKAASA